MKLHKILDSRLAVVFIIPFLLGFFSVLSFQPFNFTFINFLIIPCFFLILMYVKKKSKNVYRKKPYFKNLFLVGYFFGIGFFMSGIYWIANSLTYDEKFFIFGPKVFTSRAWWPKTRLWFPHEKWLCRGPRGHGVCAKSNA